MKRRRHWSRRHLSSRKSPVHCMATPISRHDVEIGAAVGHEGHRRAVGLDVGLHPDLHAGLVADRRRDELVAGGPHDLPGQHDRAGPDGPERPRRDQVRHPVPDLLPGVVRHPRGQRPRALARPGRLRLVRHPDLDRRLGDLQDPRHLHPGLGDSCRRSPWLGINAAQLACFLAFWAVNMFVIYLGIDSIRVPAEHQGAAADRAGACASGVGVRAGARVRADAGAALAVRPGTAEGRPVLGVLLPGADRR